MRNFPAKILLFGEHSIIHGSQALAIPYRSYHGQWHKGGDCLPLNPLFDHLTDQGESGIDMEGLRAAIERGEGFSSNIPQGMGLGSSGALVACLYDQFVLKRSSDLVSTKADLARLEAFFHGKSSGIDPLVSYLNCPLLIHSTQHVEALKNSLPPWHETNRWYLLDSGMTRKAGPLIEIFRQKCTTKDFQGECLGHLVELVGELIHGYLTFAEAEMGLLMQEISQLQLTHFKEMIPSHLVEVWEQGLKSRDFAMKLCGAGGGGYFLVYRLRDQANLPANLIAL